MRLAAFLATAAFCALALAAPDEDLLGRQEGYPVCPLAPGPTPQRCLVGMGSHLDQIAPARKVAKGAAVFELKRLADGPKIRYSHEGRAGDSDGLLRKQRITGLLVLKGDTIVLERYQDERGPKHRMQSYSMAKTVVAMLIGIALAEGRIASIDDRAEQYVAALAGHPYGETRLRDLLTMPSGVRFSENYDGAGTMSPCSRARRSFRKAREGSRACSRSPGASGRWARSSATPRPRPRCSRSCYARQAACRSPSTCPRRSGSRWAPRPTRAGSWTAAGTRSATWG